VYEQVQLDFITVEHLGDKHNLSDPFFTKEEKDNTNEPYKSPACSIGCFVKVSLSPGIYTLTREDFSNMIPLLKSYLKLLVHSLIHLTTNQGTSTVPLC
jgi:hypothetical protein